MFRISVYDIKGQGVPVILFKAVVRSWSKKINAPGTMTFSLPISDTDATATNLQKYKRVTLQRLAQDGTNTYQTVWTGYIEAAKENHEYIDVICQGNLKLFLKRYAALNQAFTGAGSTEAFGLLTTTNGTDGDTGITTGTGGVATANPVTAQRRIDILRAWEDLAAADGAEFEIDDTLKFNFVPALGSDKSASVTLRYRRDGTPGSNVVLTGFGEDGELMANRILGYTDNGGGLTSTKDDAASQATYGVLIEEKQFNQAQNQAALDAMTLSYLTQRANPLTDYAVQPILANQTFDVVSGTNQITGLQYTSLGVGDLVTADILTENQTILQSRRIAEIDVIVDEQLNETVLYTLSKSGVFVTSAYLSDDSVLQIKRRIREIDSLLT
jgi:hypothetical protein